jgi:hypothetical protein
MNSSRCLTRFLKMQRDVQPCGAGFAFRCPAHDDNHRSGTARDGDDGRVLIHCHAGCEVEEICTASGLKLRDLFPGGGTINTPASSATAQQSALAGCRLADYVAAKKLSAHFLVGVGVSEIHFGGRPALRIPYRDEAGQEVAVRFRTGLTGDDRFRWRSGAKPTLYGLWRLAAARTAGYVVIVEGESDAQTMWSYNVPALGLPGAGGWRDDRDARALEGIPTIYVVIEPDRGGETVMEWLEKSAIRERVRLVRLQDFKDPSAMHIADAAQFKSRWQAALNSAERWCDRAAADTAAKRREGWKQCASLAREPRILDRFARDLRRRGLVGEVKVAKALYLAIVSRLLDRPVSVAIKGPSSAGKSFLAKSVLDFFPASAFYALSAMSDRALAYSAEPLAHRFLVIYEAAGMQGDMATYLVRSLLSEGCVRYETVEKTKDGMKPRLIQRDGPTGLLLTTTALALHPENETRFFSLSVTDTPEQTRQVMIEMTREHRADTDFSQWHALQSWLDGAEQRVSIPYATSLAERVPTGAMRLRRDFGAILALIKAHAILHQSTRKKDADGTIVATFDDYAAVRDLLADSLAEGIEQAVSANVRETVHTVARIIGRDRFKTASLTTVAKAFKLDKGTVSRRIRAAIKQGYLKNLEERRGKEMKLRIGNPLPENVDVLPSVEALRKYCAVAVIRPGNHPPPRTRSISRAHTRMLLAPKAVSH